MSSLRPSSKAEREAASARLFQTRKRTTSGARLISASRLSAFSVSAACSPVVDKEDNRHQHQQQTQGSCQSFRSGWQRRSKKKRVMHHGLGLLRHPDGTLKSSMLTPNPYAVIARKSWRNLVDYCRTTGGDPQHTKSGLLQDTSWEGSQLLTDTDPLADSLHPFNSFLACVELPLTIPRK